MKNGDPAMSACSKSMTRRNFVSLSLEGLTMTAIPGIVSTAISVSSRPRSAIPAPAALEIKAIAFDGFPIFDSRPVFKLVKQLCPDKGDELPDNWRTRQ